MIKVPYCLPYLTLGDIEHVVNVHLRKLEHLRRCLWHPDAVRNGITHRLIRDYPAGSIRPCRGVEILSLDPEYPCFCLILPSLTLNFFVAIISRQSDSIPEPAASKRDDKKIWIVR